MCLCSCIGIYFITAFLGFEWAGLQSLVADGHFLSRWLELDVFVFALVFLVSAVMALFYAPLGGICLDASIRLNIGAGAPRTQPC